MKIERLLDVAKGVALSGSGVGGRNSRSFRLGAVLFDKQHRIITAGVNSYKTHPKLIPFTKYPFIHAEQACILNHGLDNCEGLSIAVVRVKRDGSIGNAEPCETCKTIMKVVGITKCYHSTEDSYKEERF